MRRRSKFARPNILGQGEPGGDRCVIVAEAAGEGAQAGQLLDGATLTRPPTPATIPGNSNSIRRRTISIARRERTPTVTHGASHEK